jgi:hypothetical protein
MSHNVEGEFTMSNMINTAVVAAVLTLVAAPQLAFAAERHHHAAPSTVYIPGDARGSVAPYGATEGGPYTPSVPTPAHGLNPDFQDGSRG